MCVIIVQIIDFLFNATLVIGCVLCVIAMIWLLLMDKPNL